MKTLMTVLIGLTVAGCGQLASMAMNPMAQHAVSGLMGSAASGPSSAGQVGPATLAECQPGAFGGVDMQRCQAAQMQQAQLQGMRVNQLSQQIAVTEAKFNELGQLPATPEQQVARKTLFEQNRQLRYQMAQELPLEARDPYLQNLKGWEEQAQQQLSQTAVPTAVAVPAGAGQSPVKTAPPPPVPPTSQP